MTGCDNKTISYCSPAHGGWGIVRVGMLIPESHQLFVCPFACGRHGAIGALTHKNKSRLSYLYIDEADIVSGSYEDLIIEAVEELLLALSTRPRVLMIFVSCLDDLLGTDHESILSELRKTYTDIRFGVGHMNPLTIGGKMPPPVNIQCQTYKLLEVRNVDKRVVNLLGNHVPLAKESELCQMLNAHGFTVQEIGKCTTFDEFQKMAGASLNIVLRPWSLLAAKELEKRLGIPYLYMPVAHTIEEIEEHYKQLSDTLFSNEPLGVDSWRMIVAGKVEDTLKIIGNREISIDSTATVRPFSLAKMLYEHGFSVREVVSQDCISLEKTAQEWLAQNSNVKWVNPTHHNALHRPHKSETLSIGFESGYYNNSNHVVDIVDCEGIYGYAGLVTILDRIQQAHKKETNVREMIQQFGLVV